MSGDVEYGEIVFCRDLDSAESGSTITVETEDGVWPRRVKASRHFLESLDHSAVSWGEGVLTLDVENGHAKYRLVGWLSERTADLRLVSGVLQDGTL